MTNEDAGVLSLATLTLLAANDPSNPNNAARQVRAQTEARALIATQAKIDLWKSGQIDTESKITWGIGHKLIVLGEYYLQTGDSLVLPTLEAMAIQIANGQSMFGTMGHQLALQGADGSVNGPYGVGYGPVNSAALPAYLGLLLAKECGVNAPEIDPAIERGGRFWASYSGRGAIPYGEHDPGPQNHESNGKCGLAALAFALQDNRVEERRFFTRMATAGSSEREKGHNGSYFNYLWAPLGANVGGEEAAASHFSKISWMLDLNRRWDGGFDYDCYYQGPATGQQWYGLWMSTPALLTYAMPLRQLHITGKGQNPAEWLTTAEVAATSFADLYDATTRSTNELVSDLGTWSRKVQWYAAKEIGLRTSEHVALLPTLTSLATDPVGASRVGACYALGGIAADSSAPTLAALLTDPDSKVRYAAAEAMRSLSQTAKMGELYTILSAAATTAKPILPLDDEDPLHLAHGRLGALLFAAGNPSGVISSDLTGIDRNYLYPAIRSVTAENNSWVAEARSFQNSYTDPVVVGQVMSANDPNWSVFWSMGSGRTKPADASNLNVGKHVGEDPNTTRANETLGYIVSESGSGTINGIAYEAAVGGDTVRGFGDSSVPYTYSLSGGLSSVTSAAASVAGMDGLDGSWAVLSGSPAPTTTAIGLHACEDQMNDAERSHTTTQVGYIVFE